MSEWRKAFGRICEIKAGKYLKEHGYRILKKNHESFAGEIDIIAKKRGWLVFVEVKALAHSDSFSPQDHFNHQKRKKLLFLGKHFLLKYRKEQNARFDLIAVVKKGDDYFIEHHENVIEDA